VEKIAIEKCLGMSVKNWRNRLGISQGELALRAGLHRSYVSDVERVMFLSKALRNWRTRSASLW
jgi:transcriptional regulator with XRE-family HTH domain